MEKQVKNYGRSIREKLLNITRDSGQRYQYMYLLARYFNERLLYRVSVSQYKDNFVLKGGSLLYALDGLDTRPTVDVDFLAEKINRDREYLEGVFREILSIPCEKDGVKFDIAHITSEPITVEKKYPGTRFHITALMDTIVHNMSIDIGFGDVITPCPESVDFPMLIQDNPSINLQAYSIETVIAEKFHTMIDRDVLNSRMKDFFDCYQILTSKEVNKDTLQEAINATFSNRGLTYNEDLELFTDSFRNDIMRIKRWESFLKKIKWKKTISFDEVMDVIEKNLKPLMDEYWKNA
ncbi:MAG: nucleotidyl transferase AbiEii/AbiGii toxin family protein [Bacteroidaceae bacterium]|nr:nucleotidyl transferase AbiEii/AbiGii toxin family protein [Bacteroidaceae bacterium]